MLIKREGSPLWWKCLYNDRTLPVTRCLLRATLLTLLALLGGALLVTVLTVIITSLQAYTAAPADVLPAEETLVLFSSADDALLRHYEPWLPLLKNLPPAPLSRTVAVLQIPGADKALVVFARRPVAPDALPSGAFWTRREVGPLLVAASSPVVFPLLDTPPKPLGSSEAFSLLARGEAEQQPWIFVQRALLPIPASLPDAILDTILLKSVTHLGILPRSGSGMVVRLFPAGDAGDSRPLPPLPGPAFFSLALNRPDVMFHALENGLSAERQTLLSAHVLTFFETLFGDDLSFTYDVLPLLSGPARLSVTRTASGALSLLLQGSAPDAAAKITVLHSAFRGSRTSARTIVRPFGDRFIFRNVRDDTTMITNNDIDIAGFQMHKTAHTEQGEFCSAVQGEKFLIATDCALLQHTLLKYHENPGSSAIATGLFPSPHYPALSADILPTLLQPASPLLPIRADSLQWTLSRQGDVLTLTLLPPPSVTDPSDERQRDSAGTEGILP